MPVAKKKKSNSMKGGVIHIRTAPSDKSLIEKAADQLGLTVSSFMLQNAIKAARRELAEIERCSLSGRDASIFLAAISAAPAPNAALRSAFKDYSKLSRK